MRTTTVKSAKADKPTVENLYLIEDEAKRISKTHGKNSDEMLHLKSRWILMVSELRNIGIIDIRGDFEDIFAI